MTSKLKPQFQHLKQRLTENKIVEAGKQLDKFQISAQVNQDINTRIEGLVALTPQDARRAVILLMFEVLGVEFDIACQSQKFVCSWCEQAIFRDTPFYEVQIPYFLKLPKGMKFARWRRKLCIHPQCFDDVLKCLPEVPIKGA